jgi:hypothetical protein
METPEKIKLFGDRNFTENFDMSIRFIKQNFAPIARGLACQIPVLLMAAFCMPNVFKMYYQMGYDGSHHTNDSPFGDFTLFGVITAATGYILMLLTMLAMALFTIIYMSMYVKSEDGVVDNSEVWRQVAKKALPALGGTILFGLSVVVGAIFCYIPGIIVAVYWGFYLYAYINEDLGIINSFRRSAGLVKNNFWVTLGYAIVFTIIIGFASCIFVIPFYVGVIASMFQVAFFSNVLFFTISASILLIGYVFIESTMYMAMGVMYYSHRNKLEGNDMEAEIDNIGRHDNLGTAY